MNAQLKEQPMTDRERFLADRRLGIGGSDVAPILGLSPWSTPLDVYLEKVGELPEREDTPQMAWGRALEPVIRQAYEAQTGRAVAVLKDPLVHPVHAFIRANLDGLCRDEARVFEAKTARTAEGWGEPGTDEVPDAYALQVQHYMLVTGYRVADIGVLIGGSDFRIYTVEADRGLHENLIELESQFWQRVVDRQPPEPQTLAEAQRAFGRSDAAGVVPADEAAVLAWSDLRLVRGQIKALQEREDAAKATLMRSLGESGDTLVHAGKTIATWKLAKGSARFDAAAFKAAHPDLYSQFVVTGEPSRRFLPKE